MQQLPWYLIIGAPGGGKTTALLHSGLRFPLAERLGRDPLAGIGGTRQCDWWFSQEAVFVDTAGRYTTQDSDAAADAQEWQQFLALLRRHRPVQPINGVIVSVSVPDLLQGGAELARQAAAVAARLDELRRELDLAFPIYLLVTKADLLAGFVETFGDLDAAQREQLWGVVFDADVAGVPADLGPRLADLAQRLARRSPDALQHERTPQRRLPIYAFAAQFEALLAPLEEFVREAFDGIAAEPAQRLRSIALTSGTQEGNPIDRVIGELARSHGLALKPLARPDAGGKSFFLTCAAAAPGDRRSAAGGPASAPAAFAPASRHVRRRPCLRRAARRLGPVVAELSAQPRLCRHRAHARRAVDPAHRLAGIGEPRAGAAALFAARAPGRQRWHRPE